MSDKQIIYSMVGVTKTHPPAKKVIKDISLSYYYGAKIGVLGLNGSGKSSLLKIMAGVDTDFGGDVHLSDGYSIGYLEQEPLVNESKNVRDVVREGLGEVVQLLTEFDEINAKFAEDMDADAMDKLIARQAKVQDKLDVMDAWNIDDKLDYAMAALRCPPGDQTVSELSGGERRRVALCRLLLQEPDILLLDEPTNHLDAESISWLEKHLQQYKGTVIAVTHDRYFLDNCAGWILELDRGEGIPFKGNYTSWLEQKQGRLKKEEKEESKRQKTLARELDWIRMSPKARQAKSKARIRAYDELLSTQNNDRERGLELFIPPGPRLGGVVLDATNISKSFGERTLFKNLNFKLPAGGIVGVVGPNGAGKSTLFKMITKELQPDDGSFKVGETVKLGYMEQSRSSLDDDKTVYELVSGGCDTISLGKTEINARAYLGRFNISGSDQQKKIGVLSGGERNRVQLAMMLKEQANVILLDEPTNDLDVNTLRALEDALVNFAGCAVVISHDRWFLDRIATHILAFEDDGVQWFEGNYSDYDMYRVEHLGKDPDVNKRVRYSGLTR